MGENFDLLYYGYLELYLIYRYLNKHKNYTRRINWYKARKLYLKGYRVTVKTNL